MTKAVQFYITTQGVRSAPWWESQSRMKSTLVINAKYQIWCWCCLSDPKPQWAQRRWAARLVIVNYHLQLLPKKWPISSKWVFSLFLASVFPQSVFAAAANRLTSTTCHTHERTLNYSCGNCRGVVEVSPRAAAILDSFWMEYELIIKIR